MFDRIVLEETRWEGGRGKKKGKTSDGVACFCFPSESARCAETGRGSMYVCRVLVHWGIYFFIFFPLQLSLITSQL